MGTYGERAERLFLSGYNCAQSVVAAYAEQLGMTVEQAARLASGFGGGIGRLRETCGAVSGMVLIASALRGYESPTDQEEKKRTYAMVQQLVETFRIKNGAILCRELLGEEGKDSNPNAPSVRTDAYYGRRPCQHLVACAADLLESVLSL